MWSWMDWTVLNCLMWPSPMFLQLIIPFFFLPDYRLSGSAQIPFLAHENGDIHLKDDICGEFLNNLIVIRHRRGRGGGGVMMVGNRGLRHIKC